MGNPIRWQKGEECKHSSATRQEVSMRSNFFFSYWLRIGLILMKLCGIYGLQFTHMHLRWWSSLEQLGLLGKSDVSSSVYQEHHWLSKGSHKPERNNKIVEQLVAAQVISMHAEFVTFLNRYGMWPVCVVLLLPYWSALKCTHRQAVPTVLQ